MTDKAYHHLLWRAGFGPTPGESTPTSLSNAIDRLFNDAKNFEPLKLKLDIPTGKELKSLSKEQRKALKKLNNQKLFELNFLWIKRMSSTKSVLKERMLLFWHDHFACNLKRTDAQLHLHNIMRKHALGNFKTMLTEVSKSPAMILFLNNQQNKKGHPNENFAREVMELFTLGQDNGYTEEDIKEAARAFTGWGIDRDGNFLFRSRIHDEGEKHVLGKSGNFDGNDILKILLEHPGTANYICEKIYRYFVEDKLNSKRIHDMAMVFRDHDYDISALMRHIFSSDWFYDDSVIGNKIKSPMDLIIGLNRQFKIEYEDPKTLLFVQKLLNQFLFQPPNVAGWPGGRHWIDNSTLMLRLKLPSIALNSGLIEWYDKGDMPEQVIAMAEKRFKETKSRLQKKFKANPNWNYFWKNWSGDKTAENLVDYFIQSKPSSQAKQLISKMSKGDPNDLVVEILSLPEYQMC